MDSMDCVDGEHLGLTPFVEEQWEEMVEWSKQILGEVSQLVSRPKIQDVPSYMSERIEFKRFYEPRFISFNKFSLFWEFKRRMGSPYRLKWAIMYLEETNQTLSDLYHRIAIHYDELRNLYSESHKPANEETDILEMVLDGCSMLQVLEKSNLSVYQELKITLDNLLKVHQDMLLLNHQVPFKLLQLVCKDEARLHRCLHNFLEVHGLTPPESELLHRGKETRQGQAIAVAQDFKVTVEVDDRQSDNNADPVHLLDYLRRVLLVRDFPQINMEIRVTLGSSLHHKKYRIGTIQELQAAGIHVRRNPNSNSFYPVFNDGELLLPNLSIDGSMAFIFLNLIAYEMCPDFYNKYEISSFVVFLSSLIDQPEDVKELRFAGILFNELANDKEVSDLFNMMDSVVVPETTWFACIRHDIYRHIGLKRVRIKMLGWMGEAYKTYFRSPWTIIALLAALLGLVLTFIQTWFAIHPKD